jgi:hypothetical protein
VFQLPLSLYGLSGSGFNDSEQTQLRANLTAQGLSPDQLARRRSLRFIGITSRTKTSPNTWRWHQHADWTDRLPARSVTNVSISPQLWNYFGNVQTKLTHSFNRKLWRNEEVGSPRHDPATRAALAEAVALTELGRSAELRTKLVRAMAVEPTYSEPWLRSLIVELKG